MEKVKINNKIYRAELIGDFVELIDRSKTYILPAEIFFKNAKYDHTQNFFYLDNSIQFEEFLSYDNDFENILNKFSS